jgi:hypothetical protein
MAIVIFRGFREDLVAGDVTAAADVRIIPVMTGSSVESEPEAVNLADFTTLEEFDGTGYTRGDVANVAVTHGDASTVVSGDETSFGTTVAAGTNPVIGFVYYRRVDGTAANDVAWAFNDSGELPDEPSGDDFTVDCPDGFIIIGG